MKKKSLVLDRRKQKMKTEFLRQVVPLLGSAEEKKKKIPHLHVCGPYFEGPTLYKVHFTIFFYGNVFVYQ